MAQALGLEQFLCGQGVDPQVISWFQKSQNMRSLADFAAFFTRDDCGLQSKGGFRDRDIVGQVEPFRSNMSKPQARIQISRLRTSWETVQKMQLDGSKETTTVALEGLENIGYFELENGFKWSKCARLPDGNVIFTPFNHPSILIFKPETKTWEMVGNFQGDCKWSGCAVVPTGKVVFVPQYASTILIFDYGTKSWEEVPGKVVFVPQYASTILIFDYGTKSWEEVPVDPVWQEPTDPRAKAQPKFSDCVALPDGRVLFVPYYHSSIVLFDPTTKTWEEVGKFEGSAKWNGCKMLPDGRVVFIPFASSSILLFDSRSKSWEMVGNFPGSFKWSGSELLPDGRLLFAPLKNSSALLFSPDDKSWEEVGNFGDGMKWNGCKLLPDGRVVFVPFDSPSIVVFDPQNRTWQSRPHGKMGSSAHHSGPRV
eukprot:CAMPEP_0172782732 /NCGR_PEP_ID=MMETSP1074-20121228/204077_1 /TAXON_ID=2916 /ORGANISM="Ceratium fusus, Strain PA161109" /LENGTH=424 /DNA_ID=CAMNT_0013619715 /DNA_START=72 /DNA_END=1343 /DNA_ORIENTATION=+